MGGPGPFGDGAGVVWTAGPARKRAPGAAAVLGLGSWKVLGTSIILVVILLSERACPRSQSMDFGGERLETSFVDWLI